jgi:predicted TIM-barrel fold metal-dependent hydrolase
MINWPVVDAHHHLWDLSLNYYPWLTDQIGPRLFGDDYEDIRVSYQVGEFRADYGDIPLVASVHIQAEHDPSDPVRETAWLQKVADDPGSHGFPQAIVAAAALQDANLDSLLERHRQFRNVRGIRQTLHHHPELLTNPAWRTGLSRLQAHGLSFDLQIFPENLAPALEICDANKDLEFVLCHSVLPKDPSVERRAEWRRALRELARRPNVVCKISGWAMWDRNWTADSIRPLVLGVIEAFGTDRCLFGSNYPVDRLGGSYRRIWHAYAQITADFSLDERHLLFAENAMRIYRIGR